VPSCRIEADFGLMWHLRYLDGDEGPAGEDASTHLRSGGRTLVHPPGRGVPERRLRGRAPRRCETWRCHRRTVTGLFIRSLAPQGDADRDEDGCEQAQKEEHDDEPQGGDVLV
jgi:hypothetical protein